MVNELVCFWVCNAIYNLSYRSYSSIYIYLSRAITDYIGVSKHGGSPVLTKWLLQYWKWSRNDHWAIFAVPHQFTAGIRTTKHIWRVRSDKWWLMDDYKGYYVILLLIDRGLFSNLGTGNPNENQKTKHVFLDFPELFRDFFYRAIPFQGMGHPAYFPGRQPHEAQAALEDEKVGTGFRVKRHKLPSGKQSAVEHGWTWPSHGFTFFKHGGIFHDHVKLPEDKVRFLDDHRFSPAVTSYVDVGVDP